MTGNFRNNYMPFNDYSQGQFNYNHQIPHDRGHRYADDRYTHPTPPEYRYLPHQRPYPPSTHYADNMNMPHPPPTYYTDNSRRPHPTPRDYPDNWNIPHRRPYPPPPHYGDNMNRPHHTDDRYLRHPAPKDLANKRNLSHQKSDHYADKRHSPHKMKERITDKRNFQHQKSEGYVDKECLPHPVEEDIAGKRHSPYQKPKNYADNKNIPRHTDKRYLPHSAPKDFADKRNLLHQKSDHNADKRHSPHKMKEHIADKRNFQHQKSEGYVDKECLPHPVEEDIADKRHSPYQKPKHYADSKCLPKQMLEPSVPVVHCKICDVVLPHKNLKDHNNGKKHRMLCAEPKRKCEVPKKKHKVVKRLMKRYNLNSQENPAVQPKIVPSEGSKRKLNDNTGAKDHGFKCDIRTATGDKYMKMNNGTKIPMKSSKPEANSLSNSASLTQKSKGKERHTIKNSTVKKNDQPQSTSVELKAVADSIRTESMRCDIAGITPPQVSATSPVPPPLAAVGSSSEPKNHIDSHREVTEAKDYRETHNCALERNDQPDSIGSNTLTEDICSSSGTKPIALQQGPTTSEVLTLLPAAESSFEPPIQINTQMETEGEKHHEVQTCGMETNYQPHAISTEFHAPAGSDINKLIEDTCCESGALVIAPQLSPIASKFESYCEQVIQTETSEGKVHNEIRNHNIDSNDQQRSISMEVDDPSGSMTNCHAEVVNSYSGAIAIVIEPLASAPPDALGSSFKHLTEHDAEIEPQASEDLTYIENQHPNNEPDIQLLMEIGAPSEFSAKTEVEDDSSQVEVEMDVLANELEVIHLPKVSVCLTCGDEGFVEAIVYCNKCQNYAMHRYCLKGPVIYTDDVIWFCEDCEEEVTGNADYPDQDTSDSEKGKAGSNEQCATVVDPQPVADPIWKGSLKVLNKSSDKMMGLMGHLSTLACPKVVEETRHLPDVLSAELLQRSDVWPESFIKCGTNNLSIGLYFFPQDERVERSFDHLVDEMICKDLAIKAYVEKTELLCFPSTLLPSQYRRFQSKYYLWGIFKRKQ